MNLPSPSLEIDPEIYWKLDSYELPEELGFGRTMVPIMYRAVCEDGEWVNRALLSYRPIEIDPAAKVLHYGQEIFEGMKAYSRPNGNPALFRPDKNAERMNLSARRMCMPEIPETVFLEGVSLVTAFSERFIPRDTGQSLYVRPFMMGLDPTLMLGASRRHEFYVIASPSQVYHQGRMKVMIERQECRASMGGTGAVKVGGNYGAALASAGRVLASGFDQSLWLDPEQRRYIEELSGMNVFAVIDGELHTPELNGSILPGITRDSLITLARYLGYTVHERRIAIEELLQAIRGGRCSEFFACGTAAVVTPISTVGDGAELLVEMPEAAPVATHLRDALIDIQEGRAEDSFGWNYPVPDSAYFTDLRYTNQYAL